MLLKAASHVSQRASCAILEQSPLIYRFYSASLSEGGIFLLPSSLKTIKKWLEIYFFTCLPPLLSHHFISTPTFLYILHINHLCQHQTVGNGGLRGCLCFQESFLRVYAQADWRKVSMAAFCSSAGSELNYVLSSVQHTKVVGFSSACLLENCCCGLMMPALQTSVRNSEGFSSAIVPRPMLVTMPRTP